MNIYQKLTHDFNAGRLRAILSSGQAVVYHRLALASKDGDWIIREDQEALSHILKHLESQGAHYRLGAPLALPWLRGGWSCHFEFPHEGERIRTDFVSRPPRLSEESLAQLWVEAESADFPVLDVARLIEIKKTRREKDYPVIGELARVLDDPADRIRKSYSPRDLIRLKSAFPDAWEREALNRPAIANATTLDELDEALSRERRELRERDEQRLRGFALAGLKWHERWTELSHEADKLPLTQAHEMLVQAADELLPTHPSPTV